MFCAPGLPYSCTCISCSYLIEFNVCYLVLCDKTYPKNLAFLYLKELQKEFHDSYGREVDTAARPYAFVKFGTQHFIWLKLASNTRSSL